jgi:N-acetylmuramoyl-L-alanine amidase
MQAAKDDNPMRTVVRLVFMLVAAASASGALANAVADMRVIGDSERTRFVVDLDATPQYAVSRLSNPDRLVIDLPDVEFGAPAQAAEGRGLVSDYRYGLIAPKKARIVLDLAGPVEIVNTFVLEPVSPEPARLVIDLAPTSTEKFQADVRRDRPQQVSAAPRSGGPPLAEGGRPIVVLDPGHGGIDSGAVGDGGLVERDVTLKFGLELARRLKAGGVLEPVLTRDDDTFLSLGERMNIARRHHARLFISIHADTVRQDYVRGVTVYTLSDDASDALAAALAARENRSDILAGLALEDQPDDVADILVDLARRETRNLSVRFAKSLVEDMRGSFALNSNPWRRASFKVLKAPEVPSVLLELGYLSNPKDEEMFHSEDWPEKEAETVARAVEAFVSGEVTAGRPIR